MKCLCKTEGQKKKNKKNMREGENIVVLSCYFDTLEKRILGERESGKERAHKVLCNASSAVSVGKADMAPFE